MITIGYSTRSHNPAFEKLIRESVGLKDVEVIEKINNGEKSLTKIYNEILSEAKNDIVIFCHDDIYFDKKYWGKRVLEHFQKNPEYLILGVAGTRYLPKNGKWWEITGEMIGCVNHENNGKKWKSEYSPNFGNKIEPSVIVDGVFFAVNQKLKGFKKFNETYEGFHFYDVVFCYENFILGQKIGVINNIELTHRSIGKINDEWEKNRIKFSEEYKDFLPTQVFKKFNVEAQNKKDDLISIIMPIFNYGRMFNKTLESVFNSKHKNIELIIINDGTTDEYVKDKLKSLTGYSVIRILNQENSGPATARNNGIKESKGRFILTLDSDDLIHPDMISKMLLEIKKDKNISPVYCDVIHFGEENGTENKPEWSIERLLSGPFICNCSLFRREAFDATDGFDNKMDAWEDYDLWVQMAKAKYKGKRINRPLFYYFRHAKEGSISSKASSIEKQKELMDKIIRKFNS